MKKEKISNMLQFLRSLCIVLIFIGIFMIWGYVGNVDVDQMTIEECIESSCPILIGICFLSGIAKLIGGDDRRADY